MSSRPNQLVDHEQALSVYLKDMLSIPYDIETQAKQPDPSTLFNQEIEQASITVQNTDWRSTEFQALLFDVYGLKLAIPLHQLDGILTWPEKALAKIPDKPDYYLGLYSHDHHHTQVIDIAHIILPENYHNNESNQQFIISVDGGKWGLACNKVEQVVTLFPDQVKWRKHPGKRPWLAGTVLEQMCSILNIEELVKLF